MSYELVFWRQKPDCTDPPLHIYAALQDGKTIDALEQIPVENFLDDLCGSFPEIVEDGGLVFWEGGERGMFELHWSSQHVLCCCRGLQAEEMNKIIDIAHTFSCPLYDPQVDTRFTG